MAASSRSPSSDEKREKIPFLSISRRCMLRTNPDELDAYYADRRLMWRNLVFIGSANVGWSKALQLVTPLMAVTLLDLGVRENIQATVNMANFWTVSFLVMLFSWMSDHTVSHLGRRKPYLFIAAPAIIIAICLFPFFASLGWTWVLLATWVIYLLFMDLKNSTFALIIIDCMPRPILARASSILGICAGLAGFLISWYAGSLIKLGEWVPFAFAGGVMTLTTLSAWFIKEPPVYHPPAEPFKPWSTFKVAAQDKRIFLLMAGVAMMTGYNAVANPAAANPLLWFWSKETLGLSRGDIFQAVAWAALANMVLAYPMGWLIDRVGGLKVVALYWALCVVCFFLMLYVHDKASLTLLVLVQTLVFPLYQAADIMVYKSCPPKDVGSITSTNSCIRNLFIGTLGAIAGWLVYWTGHNYIVGFAIGIGFSTLGLICLLVHHWMMRSGPSSIMDRPETEISEPHPDLARAIPA